MERIFAQSRSRHSNSILFPCVVLVCVSLSLCSIFLSESYKSLYCRCCWCVVTTHGGGGCCCISSATFIFVQVHTTLCDATDWNCVPAEWVKQQCDCHSLMRNEQTNFKKASNKELQFLLRNVLSTCSSIVWLDRRGSCEELGGQGLRREVWEWQISDENRLKSLMVIYLEESWKW